MIAWLRIPIGPDSARSRSCVMSSPSLRAIENASPYSSSSTAAQDAVRSRLGPPLDEVLGSEPTGLERVVDALAVERVDASRGVADEHPVGPRDAAHGPAHGQRCRAVAGELAELPLVLPLPGVLLGELAQVDVRGPLLRGEGAGADVDEAVAEREHPAVAAHHAAGLVAQLEVRGDPRVVGDRARRVGARRDAVDGLLVPVRPEQPTEVRLAAVGDDDVLGLDGHRALGAAQDDAGEATARELDVDGAVAVEARGAGVDRGIAQRGVEHRAPDGRAVLGQVRAVPRQHQGAAEAVAAQTVVDRSALQDVVELEVLQLGDRARGEPVAAGLVAREHRAVGEQHVAAEAREVGGGRRAAGTRADDEHVRADDVGRGGGHRVLSSGAAGGCS